MKNTRYCDANDCSAEARWTAVDAHGTPIDLCDSCAEIFEWGQSQPDVSLKAIEEQSDEND